MAAIVSFFNSIIDGIRAAFDFLFNTIKDLAYVVKLLGQFTTKLPALFKWLPAGAVALLLTAFGIVVIYKIIGREG